MPRFALTFAAVLSLASLAFAQGLRVNTPAQIYSCQPAAFAYTCPNTPCTIVARPSNDQSSLLANLGDVSAKSGSVSWKPVNVAQGTSVTVWITDANGNTISSAAITVAQGTDTSCLTGSSGSSGSSNSSHSSGASSSAAKNVAASASSVTKAAATTTSQADNKASSSAASSGASLSASSGSPSASVSAGADAHSGAGISAVVKTSFAAFALVAAAAYLA